MRGLSRAYFRSKARASMNRARRSIDGRYSSKRTARPATVIGSGLIVVGGMEYPAADVTNEKGTVVAVANANRPASAIYTPAYGQSVAGATGTSARTVTTTNRSDEAAISAYLPVNGSQPGATEETQPFSTGISTPKIVLPDDGTETIAIRNADDDTDLIVIGADGHLTLHNTARVWDDLRIEPVARNTGTNAPAFTKWLDDSAGSRGVYLYLFDNATAGSQKELFFNVQMPHAWASTAIHVHVHWIASSTAASSKIRWGLEYTWAEPGAVFGNTTIIYATDPVSGDTGTTANKHQITEFAGLTPSGDQDGLSSILICRLFRDSANGADTYTGDAGLLYIDAHVELDKLGSNDEYS